MISSIKYHIHLYDDNINILNDQQCILLRAIFRKDVQQESYIFMLHQDMINNKGGYILQAIEEDRLFYYDQLLLPSSSSVTLGLSLKRKIPTRHQISTIFNKLPCYNTLDKEQAIEIHHHDYQYTDIDLLETYLFQKIPLEENKVQINNNSSTTTTTSLSNLIAKKKKKKKKIINYTI